MIARLPRSTLLPYTTLFRSDVLNHLISVQSVAGVTHHGLGFVAGLEFAFAVYAKALGRLFGAQPVRHGGGGRGLRVDQTKSQAFYRLDQTGQHFVGLGLAARVQYQQLGRRVYPRGSRCLVG